MRKFEKISFSQFSRDICDDKSLYDEYSLPRRATLKSAGYDFYAFEKVENLDDNARLLKNRLLRVYGD